MNKLVAVFYSMMLELIIKCTSFLFSRLKRVKDDKSRRGTKIGLI